SSRDSPAAWRPAPTTGSALQALRPAAPPAAAAAPPSSRSSSPPGDPSVVTAPGSPFPAAVDATASTSPSTPRIVGSPPAGASPDPARRAPGSANLANTPSCPQFDETINSPARRCNSVDPHELLYHVGHCRRG